MRDMKTQEIYTTHCRIIGMPSRKTNYQYMTQIQLQRGRNRESLKDLGAGGNTLAFPCQVPITHLCHDPLDAQQTGTLVSNMDSGWKGMLWHMDQWVDAGSWGDVSPGREQAVFWTSCSIWVRT